MTPLLTPAAVAEVLAVSVDTVQRMAASGELPGLRVGRQWRFQQEAVSAWLAARQRAHTNAGDGGFPSPAEMPASGERLGTLVSVRSLPRDETRGDYVPVFGFLHQSPSGGDVAASVAHAANRGRGDTEASDAPGRGKPGRPSRIRQAKRRPA